ncbi:MAG TPA: cytochrome C oxidase subunit IV family protein [Thermoanaerobaculia bacterium]|jgi:cytochrome c oxidase subunit 4|nr:cytochrome C oxidase subunit IV family protein [Thermoanaerobaculia bacterium]
MSLHVVPLRVYIIVFLSLMVGTALTVAAAFVDLGWMNNLVAMAIAATKATIVILFFMHVRYSSRLISLVVVGSFFWLALLIVLSLSDYFTRGFLGVPGR